MTKSKSTLSSALSSAPSSASSSASSKKTRTTPSVVALDLQEATRRRQLRLVVAIEILAEASKGHAEAIKSLAEAARVLSVIEHSPTEVKVIALDQAEGFVRRAMRSAPRATRRRTPSPSAPHPTTPPTHDV